MDPERKQRDVFGGHIHQWVNELPRGEHLIKAHEQVWLPRAVSISKRS